MTQYIPEGTDVKVHMNLHKKRHGHPDQWSVLDAKTNKLIGNVSTITLTNCRPVDPSGSKGGTNKKYEDILKDGKRRVVADIRGTVTHLTDVAGGRIHDSEICTSGACQLDIARDSVEVHYDPRRCKYFTYQDGSKYTGSATAHFPFGTTYFLEMCCGYKHIAEVSNV